MLNINPGNSVHEETIAPLDYYVQISERGPQVGLKEDKKLKTDFLQNFIGKVFELI